MKKRLLAELLHPDEKSIIVIAGANGSGKSTLFEGLELKYEFAHLDPDKVAKAVDGQATFSAGRESIELRSKMFRDDATFGLETTLSGKTLSNFLKACRDVNYRVVLVYIWLDNPQLCMERVAVRVAGGGHYVPDEDVVRRFFRSNVNFWIQYRMIADRWLLFYNGHKKPKLVASGVKDTYDIHSKQLFESYKGLVDECKSELNSKRNK